MYIECAPPEVRGGLVGLQQLAITTGIMISFWIDYGTQYIGGVGEGQSVAAWIVPLCLQLVPALLLGAGMIFMPFSPRWLVHHGREAEAKKTLASLRGLSQDDELIELEYTENQSAVAFRKAHSRRAFPAPGRWLCYVHYQAAICRRRLAFQVEANASKNRSCHHYHVLPTMDRHQRHLVLRSSDLPRPWSLYRHCFTASYRRRRDRHVGMYIRKCKPHEAGDDMLTRSF